MSKFRKIARLILGLDDTETSDQEIFIKDLYLSQKNSFKNIEKQHVTAFLDTLTKKHDLIDFSLIKNKQIVLSTDNIDKKEVLKFYNFFEDIKDSLKDRIVLLRDNPWICMFEKDKLVFIAKREVKLSESEINAIAHDVLNAKELFAKNMIEEYAYAKV